MKRHYVSCPIQNYYDVERKSHKHFRDYLKSGEWFTVDFCIARSYVHNLVQSIGNADVPEKKELCFPRLFDLPSAMDELVAEDPALHAWLIQNGYKEYYVSDGPAQGYRVCGKGIDMPAKLFYEITLSEHRKR